MNPTLPIIDRSRIPDIIRNRLSGLHASQIEVIDDSARHAGHAGAKEGGHFTLTISAECFSGKTTLQRHRMVLDLLGNLKESGIHALSIVALVPLLKE